MQVARPLVACDEEEVGSNVVVRQQRLSASQKIQCLYSITKVEWFQVRRGGDRKCGDLMRTMIDKSDEVVFVRR